MSGYEFWIDRGGTFTDIIVKRPDQTLEVQKLLSNSPEHYTDPVIEGITRFLEKENLSTDCISSLKIGTTVSTNALLEREGVKTLFVTTKGFKDILKIGNQARKDLFNLKIEKKEQLFSEVLEIDERISSEGDILKEPQELKNENLEEFLIKLQSYRNQGFESVAISFVNSFLNPIHEISLKTIFKKAGFKEITLSTETHPMIRFFPRSETTVLDAYLSPVLKNYTSKIEEHFTESSIHFMQSSGGSCKGESFRAKNSLLSGPAGGYVALAKLAELTGRSQAIGFDMGGTSTDVSHYSGELERIYEKEIAGFTVSSPSLGIHTIASGGGSIVMDDGEKLSVGPASAGSDPGPHCYGKNGPLTITDCNLILGRINADFFPKIFGSSGDKPLFKDATFRFFTSKYGDIYRALEFTHLAVEQMAGAIHKISTKRGISLEGYVLNCFGGAGAQLICPLSEKVGIEEVFIHSTSGVFSALGIGLSRESKISELSVLKPLDTLEIEKIHKDFESLIDKNHTTLGASEYIKDQCRYKLRYEGTETLIVIESDELSKIVPEFEKKHEVLFGFISKDRKIILESLEVESIADYELPSIDRRFENKSKKLSPESQTEILFKSGKFNVPVYKSEYLFPGLELMGPAQIIEPHTTIVVDPGWSLKVTNKGDFILKKDSSKNKPLIEERNKEKKLKSDPLTLEILNNRFQNIAEEMGIVLQKTSLSVNIRERLDFSCALFNSKGELISNAPHIPVHLGSMSDSVKSVMAKFEIQMKPGSSFLLNSPYDGGTHLPDLTVVTPVFIENSKNHLDSIDSFGSSKCLNSGKSVEPEFFLASRGHHPDIGGVSPGSMPPFSKNISEEGVLIKPIQIVENGELNEDLLKDILKNSKNPQFPARNPEGNISDIKAMLAANKRGHIEIKNLIEQYPLSTVNFYMDKIMDYSARKVLKVLSKLNSFQNVIYQMDTGSKILVCLSRKSNRFLIDFTGTSLQGDHNHNCPLSVTRAVVLYVLRSLINQDIPLNDGCLKFVDLIVPEGSILNCTEPHGVVAGNVETSQALANALVLAFGVQAASQGTMNNLLFGNEHFQYYETIAGGAGAGLDQETGEPYSGVDAVQTHMTNSRITDVEILESCYPVRVNEFSIRTDASINSELNAGSARLAPNSGEGSVSTGGRGVIREFEFLETMDVSILSGHRVNPPPGLGGGAAGQCGENLYLMNTDSGEYEEKTLKGFDQVSVSKGDRLRIKTPGGGGVSFCR